MTMRDGLWGCKEENLEHRLVRHELRLSHGKFPDPFYWKGKG